MITNFNLTVKFYKKPNRLQINNFNQYKNTYHKNNHIYNK
jgi:hypothetical protein